MARSVSYRLDEKLKRQLSERAAADGTTETRLVSQLLDEGLKTASWPGIVYRSGPMGRRAGVAGGPDVWQIVLAARHATGQGEAKIADVGEQMSLPAHTVRLAVNFAAAHPDEVEQTIAANEAAANRARQFAEQRERLIAS